MPTENKLWLPPLSPKDQQKLDRPRSKGKKSRHLRVVKMVIVIASCFVNGYNLTE